MGLEYLYTEGKKACADGPLKVKLDGKPVGEIRKVKDGYQYYAKGEKKGGTVFPVVSGVQRDLLGIQKDKAPFNIKKGDTDAEAIKATKKINARLEADLKYMSNQFDRATVLLTATATLFKKQKDSKTVLNILEETSIYDDTECDGFCLLEDINSLIED
jgi:hypothetical protein